MISEQQIRDMEPGIELDKLVSIRVMGWEVRREYEKDGSFHEIYYRDGHPYENANYTDHWQPSKFIDAAWEVLDRMKEKGAEINVGFYREWDCTLDYPIGCNWREVGKTAPEAICKAALVALRPEFEFERRE